MVQQGQSYNGTVISPENGIVVTKYNTGGIILADTTLNATTGIKIRKTADNGVTWTDKFYINTSGDIVMSGNIVAGSTISIGSGSSIFKADTNGIYLGNAVYASAPFRVDLNSNLTAINIDL
jgi:hypothetical protein